MRTTILRALPAFVLLATILVPSAAIAESAQWSRVDITLHSESNADTLLVAGILPQTAKLPIAAQLPVPAGAQVKWMGQILGGDPASDPELEQSKTTVGDADIYKFVLTKSPAVQIEVVSAEKTLYDGKTYRPTLRWVSTQAIPEVRLSVRVPEGAKIVQPAEGASMAAGSEGFAYYTKTLRDVKSGDRLELAFAYEADAVAAPQPTSGGGADGSAADSSPSPLPVLVLVLLVVGGAVGLLVLKRGRSKGRAEGSDSSSSAALKRNVATAAVAAVLIAAVAIVGQQATKPQITGDTITRVFSQEEPCTSAKIALSVPQNADHTRVAEQLFDALGATKGGVAKATYNLKTATLEVGFCDSKSSEDAVRAALAPTGMVAATAETPSSPNP
jgi:hypothetical protein